MEALPIGSPYHRIARNIQLQGAVLGNKVPAKAAKHHLLVPPHRRNKVHTVSRREDKGHRLPAVIKRHHAHAIAQLPVFNHLRLRIHRKIHNAIVRPKGHHLAAAVASSYNIKNCSGYRNQIFIRHTITFFL